VRHIAVISFVAIFSVAFANADALGLAAAAITTATGSP
jgi:hypothetical protein